MAAGRWYPSVTPLRNGEMLITEGGPDMPEVRTTDGSLRALTTRVAQPAALPWLDVAPDGRAFYSGPDQTMRRLDTTGTGAWQTFGQRDALNRDYGSHAIYDIGKILVAGRRRARAPTRGSSTSTARPAGVRHRADGLRAPPAQPHGARRRHGARHRRQLVGRRARRPRQRRLPRRAVESGDRPVEDARRDAGDAPVPLDRAAAA